MRSPSVARRPALSLGQTWNIDFSINAPSMQTLCPRWPSDRASPSQPEGWSGGRVALNCGGSGLGVGGSLMFCRLRIRQGCRAWAAGAELVELGQTGSGPSQSPPRRISSRQQDLSRIDLGLEHQFQDEVTRHRSSALMTATIRRPVSTRRLRHAKPQSARVREARLCIVQRSSAGGQGPNRSCFLRDTRWGLLEHRGRGRRAVAVAISPPSGQRSKQRQGGARPDRRASRGRAHAGRRLRCRWDWAQG